MGNPYSEALNDELHSHFPYSIFPSACSSGSRSALRLAFWWAQQTLGGITGEVTDASGGVIPNVTVTVVRRTDLTDSDHQDQRRGQNIRLSILPIGTYTLTYSR
jgi:hypothetical protein